MGRFEGKVSIVTGAGGGIGEGYAKGLAAEGAAVVVADINVEGAERVAAEIAAAGGDAVAVAVDVSDEASTKAMAPSWSLCIFQFPAMMVRMPCGRLWVAGGKDHCTSRSALLGGNGSSTGDRWGASLTKATDPDG